MNSPGLTAPADPLARPWESLLAPAVVFGLALAAGLALRWWVLRILGRRDGPEDHRISRLLRVSIEKPSIVWVLLLAARLASELLPLQVSAQQRIGRNLLILWVISGTLAAAAFARRWIRMWGMSAPGRIPVTNLTQNVVRLAVLGMGLLVLLKQLGISIAPMLTALGLGGLAVALAVRPTLSNLFSGIFVSVARHVRPGDYIRLSSGEEGFVQDITWRSTTVRVLANNLVIIPNAIFADEIVTNFDLPDRRVPVRIPVGVTYGADPEKVQEALLDVARGAIGQIPGLLEDPPPAVRFNPGFGESSLDFTLVVHAARFTDQFLAQSELRRRVLRRFREEGIEIPFPVRTLRMEPSDGDGPPERRKAR